MSDTIKATDENINQIVKEEIERLGSNADLNHIDVSEVTNMDSLFDFSPFHSGEAFNGDISKWDVSKVVNMNSMFRENWDFNGDLSKWDVSSVEDMEAMFARTKYVRDLSKWDLKNLRTAKWMFMQNIGFDVDMIANWNAPKLETKHQMFTDEESTRKAFNAPLS